MKKRWTLILTILALSSFIAAQTESCLQNQSHPNYHSITQISQTDTIVREYILHIPENYDNTVASPLVINFHGFGDCAFDYAENIGNFYAFNALADSENFIVAYPQGAWRPEKESTYWQPGDNGLQDIYENDVYFTEALIMDISSHYNIDLSQVFAAGYSNGGMMAYSIACSRGDLLAAAGIVSGTMLSETCLQSEYTPIIIFHGVYDEVLPYEGNIYYQSVAEVADFWLNHNNIPTSSLVSTSLNGTNVLREEYSGGTENTCLTVYSIYEEWDKEAGHDWFSDQIEGLHPNQILWNFFSDNCSLINHTEALDKPEQSYTIQPNPFHHQMTIESEIVTNQHYQIYNLQGQEVLSGKINAQSLQIDLSSLSSQLYFLHIEGQIYKLVKME